MSDDAKFQKAIDALHKKRQESGVDINGKLYSLVKDRLETFRLIFGSDYGIDTTVDYSEGFHKGAVIVAVAKIGDKETGKIMASGHAMDIIGQDEVSMTAPIEAAETAAIGRALATFGLHGGEFASEAEMTAVPRKNENMRTRSDNRADGGANIVTRYQNINTGQDNNQRQGKPPASMPDNIYRPSPDDGLEVEVQVNNIQAMVENEINDPQTLTRYWSSLGDFRAHLSNEYPDLLSELKATFHKRNAELN